MPGRDGALLDVELRTAGGDRPVVVVRPPAGAVAERLARAGYAVVSLAGDAPDDLALVLDALRRGDFGLMPAGVGVLPAELASEASADAAVRWCTTHLPC